MNNNNYHTQIPPMQPMQPMQGVPANLMNEIAVNNQLLQKKDISSN